MTIKTIKGSDTGYHTNEGTLANKLRTALEALQRGERPREEISDGERRAYVGTRNSDELRDSDILGGTDINSAVRHSEIKKADGSSADKTHSLTEEHEINKASSSVTPIAGDNSVKYQTSHAHSDSDDEVYTSCFSLREKRKRVAHEQKPSSKLDHIGIGLVLTGSCLMSIGVGVVVAVVAGVAIVLTAGVGVAVLGPAVGAAAASSAVGAAVGTGIAVGVDAISVDAVGVDVVSVDAVGVDAVSSTTITR